MDRWSLKKGGVTTTLTFVLNTKYVAWIKRKKLVYFGKRQEEEEEERGRRKGKEDLFFLRLTWS